MSAGDPVGEGLAAALIQLAAHAERIGGLDVREADHHQEAASRLTALAAEVAALSRRAEGSGATLARHTVILDGLEGLGSQVAALADRLAMLGISNAAEDGSHYQPVPAPRWWKLTGPERETALDRLNAWVEQIYKPSYGRLAATLPPCWQQHPVCLYTLDWLSELWSALYLTPTRTTATLAGQAEWQTRLLPAAAEQMTVDTHGCQHHTRPRR